MEGKISICARSAKISSTLTIRTGAELLIGAIGVVGIFTDKPSSRSVWMCQGIM
jgi:hypothetical protein